MTRAGEILLYCCLVYSFMPLAGAEDAAPLPEAPAAAATPWPELAAVNFLDERVFAHLRKMRLVPSERADDATFLRRLMLTTTGQLPTPDEVRAFLSDGSADKRVRKIDELLEHKLHAAVWATEYCKLTGNRLAAVDGPEELKSKRAKMWHDWLRRRFEQNVPYDQIVRSIVTATSYEAGQRDAWIDDEVALTRSAQAGFDGSYAERPMLDLFWRRDLVDGVYPAEEMAERVASSFLGVRINCAKCHNHPFDRWTQQDYQALVAVFGQVRFDMSPALRAEIADRIEARRQRAAQGQDVGPPLPRIREVYVVAPTANATQPKALGGPAISCTTDDGTPSDARVALMDWLAERDNPFFARNIVNRVWAHYFGRGIVEPLDGLAVTSTAAHAQLLDELAADFVEHGYDLRRLETQILNSTTWQLSSVPNDTNRFDGDHFSRALVRVSQAETLLDMWSDATGTPLNFGDQYPAGIRAVEIGATGIGGDRWGGLLKLFGRSTRTQTCDCQETRGPTIRQVLSLMSDENLLRDLSESELVRTCAEADDAAAAVEELFLRTVSRPPNQDERTAAVEMIEATEDRRAAFVDVLWGLVNTAEFVTNH